MVREGGGGGGKVGHVTLPQALLPESLGTLHLPEHFGFQYF